MGLVLEWVGSLALDFSFSLTAYFAWIRWDLACCGICFWYARGIRRRAVNVRISRVIAEVISSSLLIWLSVVLYHWRQPWESLGLADSWGWIAFIAGNSFLIASIAFLDCRRFSKLLPFMAMRSVGLKDWWWCPPLFPVTIWNSLKTNAPDSMDLSSGFVARLFDP